MYINVCGCFWLVFIACHADLPHATADHIATDSQPRKVAIRHAIRHGEEGDTPGLGKDFTPPIHLHNMRDHCLSNSRLLFHFPGCVDTTRKETLLLDFPPSLYAGSTAN